MSNFPAGHQLQRGGRGRRVPYFRNRAPPSLYASLCNFVFFLVYYRNSVFGRISPALNTHSCPSNFYIEKPPITKNAGRATRRLWHSKTCFGWNRNSHAFARSLISFRATKDWEYNMGGASRPLRACESVNKTSVLNGTPPLSGLFWACLGASWRRCGVREQLVGCVLFHVPLFCMFLAFPSRNVDVHFKYACTLHSHRIAAAEQQPSKSCSARLAQERTDFLLHT